jgi:hypothetical protein
VRPVARFPRSCPFVPIVCSVLIVVLALSDSSPIPVRGVAAEAMAESPVDLPRLLTDPATWWMVDSNSTLLTATWVGVDPDCSFSSAWYRWTLDNESDGAALSTTLGSATNLTAGADESGTVIVRVTGLAVLDCANESTTVLGHAVSNVSVEPPLTIDQFATLQNPSEPGTPVNFTANVTGGRPPYSIRLEWGDGTLLSENVSGPGQVLFNHTFSPGSFVPHLYASDSSGMAAQDSVATPVVVGSGLIAGIVSNRSEVDAGISVQFHASALNVPPGSSYDWACPEPSPPAGFDLAGQQNFDCEFPEPGPAEAVFEVYPPGGLAPATAYFPIRVLPLPRLVPITPNITGELGSTAWFAFNLTGGVPPFDVSWTETGSPDLGTLEVPSNGLVIFPLRARVAGEFWLDVRVIDSDGAPSANSSVRLVVNSSLTGSATSARAENPLGIEVAVATAVTGGVPPYVWCVSSSVSPVNDSSPFGTLPTMGTFLWWGVFNSTAGTSGTLVVLDSAGAVWTETFSIEGLSPFTVRAAIESGGLAPPGSFVVNLSATGGLPPFALGIEATDGQIWNRTWTSYGDISWLFSSEVAGNLTLTLSVRDSVGSEVNSTWEVQVRSVPAGGPSASVPSGPLETLGAAVGAVVLAGILYALWQRHRHRPTTAPSPDPVGVLRNIIEPAEGSDRTTVELLAEEAGVPLDMARRTLDHLIAEGTVLTEASSDGGEVVSWARPTPS